MEPEPSSSYHLLLTSLVLVNLLLGSHSGGTLSAVSPKLADNRTLPAYGLPSPAVLSLWWPWFQEWALQSLPIGAFVQPLTPVLGKGPCPVSSYHP
jgi:hypothetical protein